MTFRENILGLKSFLSHTTIIYKSPEWVWKWHTWSVQNETSHTFTLCSQIRAVLKSSFVFRYLCMISKMLFHMTHFTSFHFNDLFFKLIITVMLQLRCVINTLISSHCSWHASFLLFVGCRHETLWRCAIFSYHMHGTKNVAGVASLNLTDMTCTLPSLYFCTMMYCDIL